MGTGNLLKGLISKNCALVCVLFDYRFDFSVNLECLNISSTFVISPSTLRSIGRRWEDDSRCPGSIPDDGRWEEVDDELFLLVVVVTIKEPKWGRLKSSTLKKIAKNAKGFVNIWIFTNFIQLKVFHFPEMLIEFNSRVESV